MDYSQSNAGKKNTIANMTSMGLCEANLITDTNEHEGVFKVLVFIEDAVFTTLTTTTVKLNGGSFATASDWGTVEKGTKLIGEFTNIKLSSGKILTYEEARIDID